MNPFLKIWEAFKSIDNIFKRPSSTAKSTRPGATSSLPPGATACGTGCPVEHSTPGKPSIKCLRKAMGADPDVVNPTIDKYYQPLIDTMEKYNISTPAKRSLFLGQIAHETKNLSSPEEQNQKIIFLKKEDGTVEGYDVMIGSEKIEGDKRTLRVRKRCTPEVVDYYYKDENGSLQSREEYDLRYTSQDSSNKKETIVLKTRDDPSVVKEYNYLEYLNQNDAFVERSPIGDASKDYGAGGFHTTGAKNKIDFLNDWNAQPEQRNNLAQIDDIGKKPELVAASAGYYWNSIINIPKDISGKGPLDRDISTPNNSIDNEAIDKVSSGINAGERRTDPDKWQHRRDRTNEIFHILNTPGCSEDSPPPAV